MFEYPLSALALNLTLSLSAGEGDIPVREKKVRPFSMFDSVDSTGGTGIPTTATLRKNQSSEDLLRDGQVFRKCAVLLELQSYFAFCACQDKEVDQIGQYYEHCHE